jgi:hypothetical protein
MVSGWPCCRIPGYIFSVVLPDHTFLAASLPSRISATLPKKESILPITVIYITDKEFLTTGRKLYQANICTVPTGVDALLPDPDIAIDGLCPNPAIAQVSVRYPLPALLQNAHLMVTCRLSGQPLLT